MSKHKKERFEVPGTIVETKSGRYIAFYEHRTDIIASGENEKDAKKNLKKLYAEVLEFEKDEDDKSKAAITLPKGTKTKQFTEKLASI